MRIILKIISIFTIIAVATFLLANIANSIFGNKNPSLGKSFSVKKSKSFGGVILLSLMPEKANENLPQKINFLLLGNPGPGNNAPNLTDTIMLASLKPRDKKIYFFSIPRDIYARIGESQNFSKINSLYEIGKNQNPDFPANLIIEATQKITGEKIDYFSIMDLSAVKKIVNDLGGLNVDVSETINDPQFPTASNGYETFRIDKGQKYLDGETTLKYLRTRHSSGGDFSRMKRQQDVIEAFRKKIFGLNILWDFSKILRIYTELQSHIETNMDFEEMRMIYKIIKKITPENLIYKVIDEKVTGLVITDNINIENGLVASIVKPRNGIENYEDIKNFIKSTLEF